MARVAHPLLVASGMNPRKPSFAPSAPRTQPRRARRRAASEDWTDLGADFLRAVTSGSRFREESPELAGMREFQVNVLA